MSFDLYFVRRPEDDDWDAAMDGLAASAGAPATNTDRELWQRVEAGVRTVLPEVEASEGDRFRELTETGLTAYDPQDDRPFLASEGDSGRVFDRVADNVAHLGPAEPAPATPDAPPRKSWFQRLFGRTQR